MLKECALAYVNYFLVLFFLNVSSDQVNRLVRQGRISDTGKRLPQVDVLLGDGTWVQHTDNGVVYSFDVQHCMFSQGEQQMTLHAQCNQCFCSAWRET